MQCARSSAVIWIWCVKGVVYWKDHGLEKNVCIFISKRNGVVQNLMLSILVFKLPTNVNNSCYYTTTSLMNSIKLPNSTSSLNKHQQTVQLTKTSSVCCDPIVVTHSLKLNSRVFQSTCSYVNKSCKTLSVRTTSNGYTYRLRMLRLLHHAGCEWCHWRVVFLSLFHRPLLFCGSEAKKLMSCLMQEQNVRFFTKKKKTGGVSFYSISTLKSDDKSFGRKTQLNYVVRTFLIILVMRRKNFLREMRQTKNCITLQYWLLYNIHMIRYRDACPLKE